jgi:hypothetical protein
MTKTTEKRFDAATDIFEKYRKHLQKSGSMSTAAFEKELRDLWEVGYQTIKSLVLELSKIRRYRYIAAYYMEHIYPGGPAAEFKSRLAKMYGASSYHYSKAMTEKREAFWSGLESEDETEDF